MLDGNNTVTSTKYTVTNNGTNAGTISGVSFGTTLPALIANLKKADLALLNITDGANMVIPTKIYNKDTLSIKAGTKTEVVASTSHFVEVMAQNSYNFV